MSFFISWIQIFLITVLTLILWTTNESQAVNHCTREAGHKHPNGGGFVADTAEVSKSVFVSSDSVICGHAKVSGNVIVTAQSMILQSPSISGLSGQVLIIASEISGYAQVSGPASFLNSKATDHTRVFGGVYLVNSQVVDYGQAFGEGHIINKFITGHVKYNAQTCLDALK